MIVNLWRDQTKIDELEVERPLSPQNFEDIIWESSEVIVLVSPSERVSVHGRFEHKLQIQRFASSWHDLSVYNVKISRFKDNIFLQDK